MLNHLVIWDYWLAKTRQGQSDSAAVFLGHTDLEKEAFDRVMGSTVHKLNLFEKRRMM